jgi:hypothetical protein
MVQNTQPPEHSSFSLTLDGRAPEELLKAGKYDWIADYSRQIAHSKVSAVTEADIEIVLLGSLPQLVQEVSQPPVIDLSSVFTQYDQPEVRDALQFGAQYPDEQRKTSIIFPHEPWRAPHGPEFVLVLRTDLTRARGLSYVPFSSMVAQTWWWWPRVAVRRRGGSRT